MTDEHRTELAELREQVGALQVESKDLRDHRTRVQTLLTLASGLAVIVTLGAVSVRDSVLRQEAAVTALAARVAALEVSAGRRDTDDRATSSSIVRLQATVETLQTTLARRLDTIEQRLASPPPR